MLTDGRTDDGLKVITIAHPEYSSGELKKMLVNVNLSLSAFFNSVCADTCMLNCEYKSEGDSSQ